MRLSPRTLGRILDPVRSFPSTPSSSHLSLSFESCFYLFLVVRDHCCCTRVFLSLRQAGRLLSSCSAQASLCGDFSCRAWALGAQAPVSGSQALLLRGMWDLPGPGIEPVSLALVGRFLSTGPSGKSLIGIWPSVLSPGFLSPGRPGSRPPGLSLSQRRLLCAPGQQPSAPGQESSPWHTTLRSCFPAPV